MNRGVLAFDRFVVLILGLALIGAGAAAAVWGSGRVSSFHGTLELGRLADATRTTWWPWALGVGGGLLVILGFRWLFSHARRPGTGPIRLRGTNRSGRLTADPDPVVAAAAEALQDTDGVRSARGRLTRDRGEVVAVLNAAIDPAAELHRIADAATEISAQLRNVLGRDDVHLRVKLHLARRTTLPRTYGLDRKAH